MKETYYLNREALPTIPVPHDCVIQKIALEDQGITFFFEDDIFNRDSIRHVKPDAKSLIIRYHFVSNADDLAVYKWVKPRKPFSREGRYVRLANHTLAELPKGRVKLEYLYHNVGYCSIITKLFSNGYLILDAHVDAVEFEWIY